MSAADNSEVVGEGGMQLMKHSNPDAALVLLFGWAGCSDRYLAKYSKFYEKKKLMSAADNSEVVGEGGMQLMKHSNPDAALVLLFGWAGCSDRYLAKIFQIL
ncbi:hypothetical protein WUBG_18468 [Wuchereria bancrofti]|uniref:Uncharacterized protein n=1 Tax=Wuchereria bancrofti TaxID=6293 RepID=J9A9K9_WUCBA|nr:hypothetical protein WUBG_18468 [Wuchereria bancrofti]